MAAGPAKQKGGAGGKASGSPFTGRFSAQPPLAFPPGKAAAHALRAAAAQKPSPRASDEGRPRPLLRDYRRARSTATGGARLPQFAKVVVRRRQGGFLQLPCSLGFRLAASATGGARLPQFAKVVVRRRQGGFLQLPCSLGFRLAASATGGARLRPPLGRSGRQGPGGEGGARGLIRPGEGVHRLPDVGNTGQQQGAGKVGMVGGVGIVLGFQAEGVVLTIGDAPLAGLL